MADPIRPAAVPPLPAPPPPAAAAVVTVRPPTAPSTDANTTQLVLDRYQIRDEIGRGSFATVYRAVDGHSSTARVVAIKAIPLAKLTRKLLANLHSEIEILRKLAALHHPNIVNLVDWERHEARKHVYLVMDWCEWGDLAAFLRKHTKRAGGPLADAASLHAWAQATVRDPTSLAVGHPHAMPVGGRWGGIYHPFAMYLLGQLVSALEFLHRHSLMHRDLKPQNLLLTPPSLPSAARAASAGFSPLFPVTAQHAARFLSPEDLDDASDTASVTTALQLLPRLPDVKLADFGFARYLPTPTSLAETLCGSPLYMAPEILRYEKYDQKADLWSVGVILYELWFGRVPYRAQNHIEILRKIERGRDHVRFPRGVLPPLHAPAPPPAAPADVARSAPSASVLSPNTDDTPVLPGLPPQYVAHEEYDLVTHLLRQIPSHRMSLAAFFAHPVVVEARNLADSVAHWRANAYGTPAPGPRAPVPRHPVPRIDASVLASRRMHATPPPPSSSATPPPPAARVPVPVVPPRASVPPPPASAPIPIGAPRSIPAPVARHVRPTSMSPSPPHGTAGGAGASGGRPMSLPAEPTWAMRDAASGADARRASAAAALAPVRTATTAAIATGTSRFQVVPSPTSPTVNTGGTGGTAFGGITPPPAAVASAVPPPIPAPPAATAAAVALAEAVGMRKVPSVGQMILNRKTPATTVSAPSSPTTPAPSPSPQAESSPSMLAIEREYIVIDRDALHSPPPDPGRRPSTTAALARRGSSSSTTTGTPPQGMSMSAADRRRSSLALLGMVGKWAWSAAVGAAKSATGTSAASPLRTGSSSPRPSASRSVSAADMPDFDPTPSVPTFPAPRSADPHVVGVLAHVQRHARQAWAVAVLVAPRASAALVTYEVDEVDALTKMAVAIIRAGLGTLRKFLADVRVGKGAAPALWQFVADEEEDGKGMGGTGGVGEEPLVPAAETRHLLAVAEYLRRLQDVLVAQQTRVHQAVPPPRSASATQLTTTVSADRIVFAEAVQLALRATATPTNAPPASSWPAHATTATPPTPVGPGGIPNPSSQAPSAADRTHAAQTALYLFEAILAVAPNDPPSPRAAASDEWAAGVLLDASADGAATSEAGARGLSDSELVSVTMYVTDLSNQLVALEAAAAAAVANVDPGAAAGNEWEMPMAARPERRSATAIAAATVLDDPPVVVGFVPRAAAGGAEGVRDSPTSSTLL
ncbi:ULK/ULK protein kinase [Allomyces macrogynus ATCC 38327]|uniref:non-specific serine/threonine protein kinase n=1 Tax=Allomyces macrogynus (strain ATCC 38327) TaxID=578462 RepID=A0A0L0TB34_ALLM3|nr:ULK/ULK protein kinase [Allomyces macrogynus ATCC 38327]|eukprot:KNE71925.1 ULK/ULK protein kinase [Allomyces macrogynus ATCC 38327]